MNEPEILDFRKSIHDFIRLFGLLHKSKTPCGADYSVSQVLALQELQSSRQTLVELTDKLNLDRSTVSRLTEQLVQSGLVHREQNIHNRREVILSITPKGENILNELTRQSIRFIEQFLQYIPDSEHPQLITSFQHLVSALSKYRMHSSSL